MEDGQAGDGCEQGWNQRRHEGVEDARALRASKDEQVGRGCWIGCGQGEKLWADGDAGDLGVAKPFGRGGKVDGGGLDAFADEAIGHAGDGIRFKGHGGNAAQDGCSHGRAGGVAAYAEDYIGAEILDDFGAGQQTHGELGNGFEAGEERDLVEGADFDEFQFKAGCGNKARLHAASGAYEKDFGLVFGNQLVSYGESGDDVAAGAASGDEDARS